MSHLFRAELLATSLLLAGCAASSTPTTEAPQPSATVAAPTVAPTATANPLRPSILAVISNGIELTSDGNVYLLSGPINPEDDLALDIMLRDDDDGTVQFLGEAEPYSPSKSNEALVHLDLTLPSDLTTNELPILLTSGNDSAEFAIQFEPGSEWAPIITVGDPTGLTGDVVLEVTVTDLNGSDTVQSLSVEQEFNFQVPEHAEEIVAKVGSEPLSVEVLPSGITEVRFADARFDFFFTANKEIQEYISNNSLAPIEVVQVESELYEVRFSSEWPGRFQLHLTAVDADGNETSARMPVEVYWDEHPFEIRGAMIEGWAVNTVLRWTYGDFETLLDRLSANDFNFISLNPIYGLERGNSSEFSRAPATWVDGAVSTSVTDEQLAQLIQLAHEREMGVLLKPMVFVQDGTWIGVANISNAQAWF